MSDPISRFERSVVLVKESWNVLSSDGELLVLPLLSAIATLSIAGVFFGTAFLNGAFDGVKDGAHTMSVSFYAALFLFYVVQYFIVIFFNTALVGAAIERLEGGNPTVASALALAQSRVGAILGYAVISATVGVLLRMIAERFGLIGRFIEAGAGLAWTVTTFLVVPVLAAEGVGPGEAVKKSAMLLRRTWGENLIGNAGISIALSALTFVVMAAGVGGGLALYDHGMRMIAIPLFGATIATFVIIILVNVALTGIYSAVVYRYAVTGEPPAGFDRRLIEGAFRRKGS